MVDYSQAARKKKYPTAAQAVERRRKRREWAASLQGEEAIEAAKEAALRLLDRQDRSVGECRSKLAERGFNSDAIEQALQRLVEIDLLNDERYARMLVRTRHSERGLVGRALVEELRKKRIPPELIDGALEEVEDSESVAVELVERKLRSMAHVDREKKFRRLVSMLARKGYAPGVAIKVVNDALDAADQQEGQW